MPSRARPSRVLWSVSSADRGVVPEGRSCGVAWAIFGVSREAPMSKPTVHDHLRDLAAAVTALKALHAEDGPLDLRRRDQLKLQESFALGHLIRGQAGKLVAVARKTLDGQKARLHVDVGDVLQDCWVKVSQHADQYAGSSPGQAYGWLKTIVVRHCIDVHRGGKKEGEVIQQPRPDDTGPDLPPPRPPRGDEGSPADALDDALMLGRLRHWLPSLIDQSEEQAVDLMGTKAPADLHGIGKDKRIGTTRPAITKNILTWRLAKLEEEKPAVVAEVLKIAKGSVAKYAGRGAWACELGRQRLVRPEFTPEGLDSEALRLADDLDFLALRAASKARGGAQ